MTRFLGCKVVLLGCYNGQGLDTAGSAEGADPRDTDPQDADPKGTDPRNGGVVLYSREGEAEDGSGPTFVRVLLQRGRMQVGAGLARRVCGLAHVGFMLAWCCAAATMAAWSRC